MRGLLSASCADHARGSVGEAGTAELARRLFVHDDKDPLISAVDLLDFLRESGKSPPREGRPPPLTCETTQEDAIALLDELLKSGCY